MTARSVFSESDVCALLRLLRALADEPADPAARLRIAREKLGELLATPTGRRLAPVVHAELGEWLRLGNIKDGSGATGCGRGTALAPRYRRVLERLLGGDSEKQIAHALGLSRHTVHEYVKRIYRAFGVESRGELLSKWIGRPGQ
jgi:DNA-binding CsgD family transcriptional regulator